MAFPDLPVGQPLCQHASQSCPGFEVTHYGPKIPFTNFCEVVGFYRHNGEGVEFIQREV